MRLDWKNYSVSNEDVPSALAECLTLNQTKIEIILKTSQTYPVWEDDNFFVRILSLHSPLRSVKNHEHIC